MLPDKVTTIKNAAFNECSNLNSVTIPASVNSIETAAFGSCDALTDVYYAGTEDQWKEITIDELNDGLKNAAIHYQCAGGSSSEPHEHSYTAVTTAPTCTEQGYTTYTCSCNDSYVSDYVDATGHKYNSVVTQPTCEQNGYTTCTCECGDSYIANIIPATGHADNDGDGYCDACPEVLDPTLQCGCNCHKSGISKFFFDFILFFQKLFGANKNCACGVTHY